MRKIYCFVLLFASLFVVFFIACRRDYSGGIQKPDVVAVRNWLHSYGGNYRNETIEVMLQNNQKMKAKLNWNAATKYSWQGKEYIDVPFEFENHGRYVQTGEDKAMAKFNLVVRKKGDGYEGAMRNVMYDITSESTNNTTSGKVVQMYQLLDGRPANIWLSNMASEIPKAARTENISATEFANRKLQAAKKTNLSGVKPGDRLMMAQPCTTTHIVTYSGNCNYVVGDEVYVTLCRHDYYITTCETDGPPDPGTGGGGGGGDSYPPAPPDDQTPEPPKPDPCKDAKKKADSIAKALNDPAIKEHLKKFITDYKASSIEHGFLISKNADGSYSFGDTKTGDDHHINWTFPADLDIVAIVHVHPPGTSAIPSPTDIYGLNGHTNASFVGDIVISGDDMYMINVTNAEYFAKFVGKKNQYYDEYSASQWKKKSEIDDAYHEFIENAKSIYKEGTDLSFPAQLYLIKKFEMGVSLQKWNGTAFNAIATNAQYDNSTSSNATISGGQTVHSIYKSITVEQACN